MTVAVLTCRRAVFTCLFPANQLVRPSDSSLQQVYWLHWLHQSVFVSMSCLLCTCLACLSLWCCPSPPSPPPPSPFQFESNRTQLNQTY